MKVMKLVKKAGFIIMIIAICLIILIIIGLAVLPFLGKAQSTSERYRKETERAQDELAAYGNTDKKYDAGLIPAGPEMDFIAEDKGETRETGKQEEPEDSRVSEESKDSKEAEERMKVYFGFLRLRVDNVKETRSTISSLADEVGGYVESSYENTIIIRIPKQLFTEILATLMDMGEVLNKSIETYDVTDIFQDMTARLEISKKTRDRLYALLVKTKDVKERLKILKEIRRLSEEIEKISLTLENIKRLISFSRITIELEQRLSYLSYEDKRSIPFPWIASLDPFYISLSRLDGKVNIKTGDEFAVFDKKRYFFAESSEGVRIHIASTKNRPMGDADFWQKAVEYHLARFYKKTQFLDLGSFKAIEFKSKDADPFYYLVGMFVNGKTIFICEVLFPNQAAYEKLGDPVKGYIMKCEIN